jgi:hypothetical protein
MIDTLETSKRLRAAGFDEAQAEALVGMVRDAREADLARLATKDDLVLLRRDLEQLRTELRGEMAQLATGLRGEMAQLATELRGEIGQLGTELRGEIGQIGTELRGEMGQLRGELTAQIAQLETRLMLRLGAMIAAGVAFLTAIRFFA